jgi:enoyl-CoA hydratase
VALWRAGRRSARRPVGVVQCRVCARRHVELRHRRWLSLRCVGTSRAFEIMLTGRMWTPPRPNASASYRKRSMTTVAARLEIARSIVSNSAFGVWMTKRGAWANVESASLQAAIELENRTQILARTTGELAKAAEALVARRKQR